MQSDTKVSEFMFSSPGAKERDKLKENNITHILSIHDTAEPQFPDVCTMCSKSFNTQQSHGLLETYYATISSICVCICSMYVLHDVLQDFMYKCIKIADSSNSDL